MAGVIMAGIPGVSGVTGVTGVTGSGVVGSFVVLLLLAVLLTALCTDCGRRSFELRDSKVVKNPSALISVVKLEDVTAARENPAIREIQNDEREFRPPEETFVSITPWRNHLGAPHNNTDVRTNGSAAVMDTPPGASGESSTEDETSVQFTRWRSHLTAPQHQDVNSSNPPHLDPIYQTIGGGEDGRSQANAWSPPTNHVPELEGDSGGGGREGRVRSDATAAESLGRNLVYAQVSKKARQAPPPVRSPEEVQVRGEDGEEPSPPLPDRHVETEG